jgi:hypothetical protein
MRIHPIWVMIAFPQQRRKCLGLHWQSQIIALGKVTILGAEKVNLRFPFDPFRHDLYSQVPTERYDRTHDHLGIGVMSQASHKGAVDFDSVDRQLPQPGEVGVTGAEVVDGNGYAPQAQTTDTVQKLVLVRQGKGALGDLELEAMWVASTTLQSAFDGGRHVAAP